MLEKVYMMMVNGCKYISCCNRAHLPRRAQGHKYRTVPSGFMTMT
jgi:hypothetical protein